MRLVSTMLKNVVYPGLHHAGWLRRNAPVGGCAVVNYHGVIPSSYESSDAFLDGNLVSARALQKQIRFLKTNYEVVSPADYREWVLHAKELPRRAVLITCDDGLVNNLLDMLPILQSEAVECLFFITGASCSENPGMLWYEDLYHLLRRLDEAGVKLMGADAALQAGGNFQAMWWRTVLSASRLGAEEREKRMSVLREKCPVEANAPQEARWRRMNVQELRQLAQSGASIGAHTMTHPVLSECSAEESLREIADSKTALETALGKTVWAFAYPFGNPATMGPREVELARQAGFECAFLNVGGDFTDRINPFSLARTHVTADMKVAELEAHMTGFHARLQKVVRGYN